MSMIMQVEVEDGRIIQTTMEKKSKGNCIVDKVEATVPRTIDSALLFSKGQTKLPTSQK